MLLFQHDHSRVHNEHKIFVAWYAILTENHERMSLVHVLNAESQLRSAVGKALRMVSVVVDPQVSKEGTNWSVLEQISMPISAQIGQVYAFSTTIGRWSIVVNNDSINKF